MIPLSQMGTHPRGVERGLSLIQSRVTTLGGSIPGELRSWVVVPKLASFHPTWTISVAFWTEVNDETGKHGTGVPNGGRALAESGR